MNPAVAAIIWLVKRDAYAQRDSTVVKIELEQEEDGRWIAEAPELPGVIAYGDTREEGVCKTKVLALRVMADRLEHGEELPEASSVFAIAS